MSISAQALFYTSPGEAEIRDVQVRSPMADASSDAGECLVRSLYSGISRGTERLVFGGKLPESEWLRMRAPFQEGEFPFPVKYGYCNVGIIEAGPDDIVGCKAFSLFPHQDRFVLSREALVPLPHGLPERRAILSANMETALNILWDSRASAGDRIVVVGGGVVGLLTAYLATQLPGSEVTLVDPLAERKKVAEAFGATFARPDEALAQAIEADVVVNASASADGLRLACQVAGFEARIVEASWFGSERVGLDLGGAFHSRRLQLISSQVGTLPADRRARWNHRRRIEKAMALLMDDRLDMLISQEIGFARLAAALPEILQPNPHGLMTAVRYAND